MMRRVAAAATAFTLILAACDTPEPPTAPDRTASLSVVADGPADGAAPAEMTNRHLVVFKGKNGVPGSLARHVAELGGELVRTIDAAGAAVVSGLDDAAAAELQGHRAVQTVEPELVIELPEPALEPEAVRAEALPAKHSDPSAAFFYPRQWNMRAIGADEAWAAGRQGSSDVTVAILDTGIDYLYPDLAGRVDLTRSMSMLGTYLVNVADPGEEPVIVEYTENDTVAAHFPGRHPVTDLHYHGTHVAATVASNGLVTAGVTSQTTLMGVKVCGYAIACPGGAIFAGIEHAVENGADVINMSLGGLFQKRASPGFVATINRLFNYAYRNGVTVVVSAGNDAADLDRSLIPIEDEDGEVVSGHFPSLYKTYCTVPNNLCIAATGPTGSESVNGPWEDMDASASYTNYGRSAVNVAAPGGNAGGSVWAGCSSSSLVFPICQTGNFILGASGTSMASPHAAGLAALMVAEHGKNPARVRNTIQASAADLGQPGVDPFYGKGRIDVARAVGID